tara:strand:+ start:159 stop:872 length:714 start_codon:yes stop_codon:yes gene_type:complete
MAATSYYNPKTGNGWRKIQTGPNKGKYQKYKGHKPTGTIKTHLTVGSRIVKGISKAVKNAQNKNRSKLTTKANRRGRKEKKKNPNNVKPYEAGDLSKNPTRAYYSPTLGWVTGAGIKEQAAEDRKRAQIEKNRTKAQSRLEQAYDQGRKDGSETTTQEKKNTTTPPTKKVPSEKERWLDRTKNSPAAKAGFTEKERWALQEKHRKWKADRAAGKLKREKFDPRKGKNQRRRLVRKGN